MPESHHFLTNLALVLCVAAVTSLLFQRLHQPVVFGYLTAGMLIGPHIPVPLVADEGLVHTLAELGVILLMFALGLEFSLRKLFRVIPTAGIIALLQCSAMIFFGFGLGRLFGWTVLESVYAGAIIAISSTTIILKAFAEQKVSGKVADIVFGVLIIEDLIGILLIAILTAISAGGDLGPWELTRTSMRLAAFLVGLVAIGLLIVPRLIRAAVRLGRPETTLVTAVGISFATALLALSFGYSVALGAFIGGSLVAESGQAEKIEQLVAPVRDMFAAIFFVAVGMLIDPALIAQHWLPVLAFTLVVIAGKVISVSMGSFLVGYGTRTSVQTGMSLAQIGEFSFIIAGIGLATGATRSFLYPVAVAVSAITTLSTPWLIRSAGPVASYVDRKLPRPVQTYASLYESWLERLRRRSAAPTRSRVRRLLGVRLVDVLLLAAIIVGVAVVIAALTEHLAAALGWPAVWARRAVIGGAFIVSLPLLFGFFRSSRALGQAVAFEVLPAVPSGKVDFGAAPRRALLVTVQLAIVVVAGLPLMALTQPFLPPYGAPAVFAVALAVAAVAWWRGATDLRGHAQAGAEVIVAVLAKQMGAPDHGPPAPLEDVHKVLPGLGEPVALRLEPSDHAVGKSLAELDLRSRTGAVVLAINRGGEHILLPTGHEKVHAGDVLAIAGTHASVRDSTTLLREGDGGR